jgi:hypothetical protein
MTDANPFHAQLVKLTSRMEQDALRLSELQTAAARHEALNSVGAETRNQDEASTTEAVIGSTALSDQRLLAGDPCLLGGGITFTDAESPRQQG